MPYRIDPDNLRYQLARRGLTQQELAQLAGIAEPTLSRALNGRPMFPATARKLDAALARLPVLRVEPARPERVA